MSMVHFKGQLVYYRKTKTVFLKFAIVFQMCLIVSSSLVPEMIFGLCAVELVHGNRRSRQYKGMYHLNAFFQPFL